MRAWGNHMVHHAIYYKENYSYAGIIESLSGAPFDVKFLSFDDIRKDPSILAHQYEGHFFQLATVMGVEKETGFTLNVDKYNWEEHEHFITEDCAGEIDFGEGKKSIYALDNTTILVHRNKDVQLAVNEFGKGRCVYISGLPYSFENSRLLYRSIIWSSHDEENLHRWFSSNYNVEVHAYVKNKKYCVVNNTYEPQSTTVYKGDGTSFDLNLGANEIIWYEIE